MKNKERIMEEPLTIEKLNRSLMALIWGGNDNQEQAGNSQDNKEV